MDNEDVTIASTSPPLSKPVTNGLNADCKAVTALDAIANNCEQNVNEDTQTNVSSQTSSQIKIESDHDSNPDASRLLNNATPTTIKLTKSSSSSRRNSQENSSSSRRNSHEELNPESSKLSSMSNNQETNNIKNATLNNAHIKPKNEIKIEGPDGPEGSEGPESSESPEGPQDAQIPQGIERLQGPQTTEGTQSLQGPERCKSPENSQVTQGPVTSEGPKDSEGPRVTEGPKSAEGTLGNNHSQDLNSPPEDDDMDSLDDPEDIDADLDEDDEDEDDLETKHDPYLFSDGEAEGGSSSAGGSNSAQAIRRYPSIDKDSIKGEESLMSTAAAMQATTAATLAAAAAAGVNAAAAAMMAAAGTNVIAGATVSASNTSLLDRIPRPDSGGGRSDADDDGDDEDGRLVIDDVDRDHLTNLKENVLNLKSDKPRKKHLRFNGMPEEEVAKRLLPDLIKDNLDILIIGINPGLYAAFKGHHYAGPGNHFWKCMFLGGLTPKSMCADDDYKLLDHGIGFTNVVMRATRGSANLTRKEIEEGAQVLVEKIKQYKPRVAVFNGKGIYEVFQDIKEFHFGKQPEKIEGTDTYAWVMPNSSARCAQLPRAVDKVPFYAALKKFRDYIKGDLPELDETEVVFTDIKLKSFHDGSPKFAKMNSEFKIADHSDDGSDLSVDVRVDPITGKKRRGRPPKPRADGTIPPPKRRVVLDANGRPMPRGSNPIDPATGRKKRGRPKKADMLAAQAAFDAEHGHHLKDLKGEHVIAAKRESLDSSDGGFSGLGEDAKVVEAVQVPPANLGQPVQPLPSLFGRSIHNTSNEDVNSETGMKSDADNIVVNSGCDPQTEPHEQQSGNAVSADVTGNGSLDPQNPAEQRQRALFNENHTDQQQQAMQSSPSTMHTHQAYPTAFQASPAPPGGGGHPGQQSPSLSQAQQQNGNGFKSFSPNFNYAAANGSPLHSGFSGKPGSAAAGIEPGQSPVHSAHGMRSASTTGSTNDDVTTKSITGLESLVDQIPAIAAENDSGVFSGSGAGSHPNTPRSVGPYSPAGAPGSNFHTSPFHTPHFNNVPSTSDGASVGASAASENSTNYHPPTDFSVNSLVHHHHHPHQRSPSIMTSELPTSSPGNFATDSSFSVSSLTAASNYANDMASKYAAASNNPYTSSFLAGSSAAAAASAGLNPGFFGQSPNSAFMANAAAAGSMNAAAAAMTPGMAMSPSMAMSYYGQYSNTYGAGAGHAAAAASAHAGFPPSPYSAYMPNPGYPYSHYGQSPYSQSPYF